MPDTLPANADAQAEQSRALIRDLHAAADRARDERLRLAQAHKQQQQSLDQRGGPAPVEQVENLTTTIQKLERAVQDRLDTLAQAEQAIDHRAERINTLRHVIQAATDAFTTQVENAQQFKCDTDAAKQAVRDSAGEVTEVVRQALAKTEEPIAARLKQLVEMDRSIDQRIGRMQQMHKQAADAVDRQLLRALNNAKEQAAELAAPMKAELDKHLLVRAQALEEAVHAKIAELDVDIEEALSPLTTRFDGIVSVAQQQADALAKALPARLDRAMEERLVTVRDTITKQVEQLLAGNDDAVIAQMSERYQQQVTQQLEAMEEQHDTQARAVADELARRIGLASVQVQQRINAQADTRMVALEAALAKRLDAMSQSAQQSGKTITDALCQLATTTHTSVGKAQRDLAQQLSRIEPETDAAIARAEQHLRKRIAELRDGAQSMVDLSVRRLEQRYQSVGAGASRSNVAQSEGVVQSKSDPLDPRFAYDTTLASTPALALAPIIQGPIIAESLEALSKRNTRATRKSTPHAEA